MALTLQQIVDFMEEWAPLSYAESYDNPGLQVGHPEQTVERILVAVDASESVLQQACEQKADLLITHHPLIFHPVKRLVSTERNGARLLQLIENGIALYSAHTNLDTAPGGNNDRAAAQLGLTQVRAVGWPGEQACLRIGELAEPLTLSALARQVRERFQLPGVRLIGQPEQKVQRVALCTGSGMDFMPLALEQGADAFVTGDITYHRADEAQAAGLGLIDATHFGTDRLSTIWVAEELRSWAAQQGEKLTVWEAQEKDLYIPMF